MKKKILSFFLAATMFFGISGTVNAALPKDSDNATKDFGIEKNQKTILIEQINKTIENQETKDDNSKEVVELLVLSDGTDITQNLKNIDAAVDKKSTSVYLVKMPKNKAKSVANINSVTAVGKDEVVYLTKSKSDSEYNPNLEYDHELVGMSEFWRKGFNGKDITIAIIDTGIEPSNEMLKVTSDGKIKIIDYKDFCKIQRKFSDGDIQLTETKVKMKAQKKYIELQNKKIYLPECSEDKVLFGHFDESNLKYPNEYGKLLEHDINNNGKFDDKFPVVVMNYKEEDKSKYKIYVDTNLSYDLSDAKEMNIYEELVKNFKNKSIFEMDSDRLLLVDESPVVKDEYKENYDKLVNEFKNEGKGSNSKETRFNFVISDVEKRYALGGSNNSYEWVLNLSYDANGHGTHVAGDAAGNGYTKVPFMNTELLDSENKPITDGTVKGSAPGAQVMSLKVFSSNLSTTESVYMSAVEYACEKGADIINLSLGNLPEINDESAPACKLINQLSQKYGTIFCNSAGNFGPGFNTVTSPAVSEWAFTVGSYCANLINYECGKLNEDFLHSFSSRGPSEDGRIKPTIVAPGNMVSASPLWSECEIRMKSKGGGKYIQYQHMNGTSQASPYAAGILASLKQAINENDVPYHPLVLKEAIFETGDKKVHNKLYKPSEIGGGLIRPSEAYDYLMNLKKSTLTKEELKCIDKNGNEIYADRNAIVLKSEFAYSENLDYKPEGLYVRNANIPEKVYVRITNTKGINLNVKLTKDSYYYPSDWLILHESTMKLKPGESKILCLGIDKNKLGPNVNSALIKMDDENTALKEGFIPITIVNYDNLTVEQPSITVNNNENIKPGESKSHFFRIPYGVNNLKLNLNLTDSKDKGAYAIHIVNPLGVKFKAYNVPKIIYGRGFPYSSGKVEFEIYKPMPGTWEFALEFPPDICKSLGSDVLNECTGKYSLKASLDCIVFEPNEINYIGSKGEYKYENIDLKVLNSTDNEIKKVTLKSTSLVNENVDSKVTRETINNKEHKCYKFSITENDPNVFVKFKTNNANNVTDDLDLNLYQIVDGKKFNIASSKNEDSNGATRCNMKSIA